MNTSQKPIFLSLFVSSLLLLTAVAFYPLYAGSYEGRVIDTETKQPLEGAVVLAVWDKEYPTVGGRVSYFLDSEEVLTDLNGRFVVGKLPPVTFKAFVAGPRILIFCPGYAPYGIYPDYKVNPEIVLDTDTLLRTMEKEELTFELARLTREERLYVVRNIDHMDVPEKKKPNLLRLKAVERKTLGLSAKEGQISTDSLIIMNGAPDEKQLNRLRLQYKNILIYSNGRYFNSDGTPSGILFERDVPVWARELLHRISYAFSLQTQLSERPDILEETDYLPFCMKGSGSLIRTRDPIVKMHELFLSNGWKAKDRYMVDNHGSSSLGYEKKEHHCRVQFEIDKTGTIPKRFGFEIRCRGKGRQE
jgi:hypothetical protein